MDKNVEIKKPSKKRIIILSSIFVLSFGMMIFFLSGQFGSSFSWWFSEETPDLTPPTSNIKPQTAALEPLKYLSSHGFLHVNVPERGRDNPFNLAIIPSTSQYRDEQRLNDMRYFINGFAKYYKEKNMYPVGSSVVLGTKEAICLTDTGWGNTEVCNLEETKLIISRVPSDQSSSTAYVYTSNGFSYSLIFSLEQAWGDITPGEHTLTQTGIR